MTAHEAANELRRRANVTLQSALEGEVSAQSMKRLVEVVAQCRDMDAAAAYLLANATR